MIAIFNNTNDEMPIADPSLRFGPSSWRHIFNILGFIVVADGKIYKEKMDAYQNAIIELGAIIDPKLILTRQMILDWFIYHKDELTAVIDSLEYDTVLISTLRQMRNVSFKLDIVKAMAHIALADGVYSDIEKLFVKKTILYWNIRVGVDKEPTFSLPSLNLY